MIHRVLALSALCCSVATAAGVIKLDGSGTTNPSKFFWEVMSLFEARAKPEVRMTYRAVGSGTGQYEFIGKDNSYMPYSQDFGSGDIPIGKADYTALTAASKPILHFPFQMGAMSFFHNVPGVPKTGANALKLQPCTIAKIFKRDITTWDHADIIAENPKLQVPKNQKIQIFHRVLGSSTTSGITTYLNAACPAVWTNALVGKTITWPKDTTDAHVQGSGQMSSKIASTPFSIGYIDAGHGHDDGLAEIALKNKHGTYLTSLEAGAAGIGAAASEAIKAKVMPDSPSADFSAVSLHNMAGEKTWPVVAISYVYLRKDLSSYGDKACLLKAFLQFIISAEGQALLPAYGAVGVPQAVKDVATKAINALTMPSTPACTAWTFEGSSTLKGTGQADYVISAKRRAHDEYAIASLTSKITALTSQITTLEDHASTMLDGSGTTNPSKFFWEVMSLFEARAKPAVKMTYRAVGSGTGQYEFIGKDNKYMPYDQDFGSGDIPIGKTDYAALKAGGKDIMHIPFQMGAMSVFHNIPGVPKSGEGALKVDACIIAKIFKRVIKTWDHADIKALNPKLNVPAGQNIEVFHRVLGSSTTSGITTYLNVACPAVWTSDLVGKVVKWPADTNEAYGSGQMSSKIASTPYSIGYIDSGHGHEDGLKEIELQNKNGKFLSSLEAGATGIGAAAEEAIAKGVMPSKATDDFSAVSLHNQGGDKTWPIVAISYAYVRKDLTKMGAKACLLKAFLQFILDDEAQKMLPAYGAVGVPQKVKDLATAGIATLLMPACTQWTFEGSSTLKGSGQADHVVSAKRRSYYEYGHSTQASEIKTLKGYSGTVLPKVTGSIPTEYPAMSAQQAKDMIAKTGVYSAYSKAIAKSLGVSEGSISIELKVAGRRLSEAPRRLAATLTVSYSTNVPATSTKAAMLNKVKAVDTAALQTDISTNLKAAGVDQALLTNMKVPQGITANVEDTAIPVSEEITALKAEIKALKNKPAPTATKKSSDSDDTLSIVALVVSVLAIVLTCILQVIAMSRK